MKYVLILLTGCDSYTTIMFSFFILGLKFLLLVQLTCFYFVLVSQEELSAKSKDAGVSDCATQSNLALSGECTEGFEFELKGNANGKDDVQLIWKKIIEKDSIKVCCTENSFSV